MKTCFMFTGQGSQYVGMCHDFYNQYDEVKSLFKEASDIVGYRLEQVLFEDEEKLNNTLYTQVAMFVMYASVLKVLELKGITSEYSMGLSLGEYGGLYHNEVFDFKTGVEILQRRGEVMNIASSKVSGKMSAIMGLDTDLLENIISRVEGYCKIANYNTYGQLVISGEEDAVLTVNQQAVSAGAKRAIVLNTSGPFHTALMNEASVLFADYLKAVDLKEPKYNLLLNVTGDYYQTGMKQMMCEQITNSVLFYQMVEKLLKDGVDTFVEIGPKKTLGSFVKKNGSFGDYLQC